MADFWERKTPMQKTKFIFSLLLIVLLIVFSIANWQNVEFNLIFTTIQMPRTVLILSCVLVGYILAAFMEGMDKKKHRKQEKKEDTALNDTENGTIQE